MVDILTNPGTIAFGLFFLLLLLNVPISMAVGIAAVVVLAVGDLAPLSVVPYVVSGAIDSFPLLAMPLFIIAGNILTRTGIAQRLVDVPQVIFGSMPGGLAITTIATGALLGSMSGSNSATVAALSFLIGAMARLGYPLPFAVAVVAAGCTFGVVIPPSVNLIIYGVITETSIRSLFAAGVGPGLLMAVILSVYVYFVSKRAGYRGIAVEHKGQALLNALRRSSWALLTPVIILGGIYLGIFTATEAAAVAVAYTVLLAVVIDRELTFRGFLETLYDSGRTTGVIILIVATAAVFAWILQTQGMARAMTDGLIAVAGENRVLMLLLVNLVLVVTGCFLEPVAAIYLLVPLFLPAVAAVGVDPVHFGAIMTVNLSMAHITPPVGVGLYLAAQLGNVPFSTAAKWAIPFVLCELLVILIVSFVPAVSMAIPSLMS